MREEGLLGRRGEVGRHKAKVGVFKVGILEGVQGGTNVKEGIDR